MMHQGLLENPMSNPCEFCHQVYAVTPGVKPVTNKNQLPIGKTSLES